MERIMVEFNKIMLSETFGWFKIDGKTTLLEKNPRINSTERH